MNIFLYAGVGIQQYTGAGFEQYDVVDSSENCVLYSPSVSIDEQWVIAELSKLCQVAGVGSVDADITILLGMDGSIVDYTLFKSGAFKGVYATSEVADSTRHRFGWSKIGSLPVGGKATMLFKCDGPVETDQKLGFSRPTIEATIGLFFKNSEEPVCCVYGDSGTGKTASVRKVLAGFEEKEVNYFSFGESRNTSAAQWWKKYLPAGHNSIEPPEVVASRIDRHMKMKDHSEIVVLDDMQWIDEFSERLIRRICEFEHIGIKLLLVGREPFEMQGVSQVLVGNLSLQEVREFVKWYCPDWNESSLDKASEQYFELTGGHIIFCRELVEQAFLSGGKFTAVTASTKNLSEIFLGRIFKGCSDEIKILLPVLAHVSGSLSSKQVAWVAEKLDVPEFIGLEMVSCIEVSNDHYSIRHALFREVLLNKFCTEEESLKYHKVLALCYEEWNQFAAAIRHWERVGESERKVHNIELAVSDAYERFQLNQLYDLSSKYCNFIEDDCRAGRFKIEFPWYVAHAHMQMGSLEVAARFANIFLGRCGFKQSNSYAYHMLFGYFFSSMAFKKAKNVSEEQLEYLSEGAYISLEYTAFAHDNVATLSDLFRFHCLSVQSPRSFRLRGLSYALVALAYFPFFGTKGVFRIFNKALQAKSKGNSYLTQYVEYLSIHRKLHTNAWLMTYNRIDTLCLQTKESNYYDLEGKVAMYRIVFLLDRGELGEVRSYYDDLIKRLSFFPKWLRDWIGILDLSIAVSEFRMSKVIYNKNEEVNSDLVAGSNLFYATAYCYLGDIELASEHFAVVLEEFHQMKLHHSAFTICITSLLEVTLVLYWHSKISNTQVKKVFKAARAHARFVRRSGPVVKFYDQIRKKGTVDALVCDKFAKISDKLGTLYNSQLIRAHKEVACGGPEDSTSGVVSKKVSVFWNLINSVETD